MIFPFNKVVLKYLKAIPIMYLFFVVSKIRSDTPTCAQEVINILNDTGM